MDIFFDTEFTQFRNGQLLSVGLVSDADDELVVEIHDPVRHAMASKFCQGFIIPQFGAVPARQVWTDLDLGRVVAAWLGQFELPLTLCYDNELDRHFLLEALRGTEAWPFLEPHVRWVNVFEGEGFPGCRHPLVAAKAMRERWQVAPSTKPIDAGRWGICPQCFESSGTVSEMELEECRGSGHFAQFRSLSCPVCGHSDDF